MFTFKQEIPFSRRLELSERVMATHSDRIPVIVEKAPKSDLPQISKKKFLSPTDITVAKFVSEIRKNLILSPDKALFIFVNQKTIPTYGETMDILYKKYKSDDGLLYITYNGENTFGRAFFTFQTVA